MSNLQTEQLARELKNEMSFYISSVHCGIIAEFIRKREIEARIDELEKLEKEIYYVPDGVKVSKRIFELRKELGE